LAKYAEYNGKRIKDADGDPILAGAFENDPSGPMRKVAKRDVRKESERDFYLRLGFSEKEVNKMLE